MLCRFLLVFGLWATVSSAAVAQEMPDWAAPHRFESAPPPEDDPPDLPDDPPIVPVDGGLALLALAGAGYAAHCLRRRD